MYSSTFSAVKTIVVATDFVSSTEELSIKIYSCVRTRLEGQIICPVLHVKQACCPPSSYAVDATNNNQRSQPTINALSITPPPLFCVQLQLTSADADEPLYALQCCRPLLMLTNSFWHSTSAASSPIIIVIGQVHRFSVFQKSDFP